MAEVKVGKNESLDQALRRFNRECRKAGILKEVRRREHYEKPSVKRKRKLKRLVEKNVKAMINSNKTLGHKL